MDSQQNNAVRYKMHMDIVDKIHSPGKALRLEENLEELVEDLTTEYLEGLKSRKINKIRIRTK